ncbi:MAG TPA: epimerase, partial [Phycisphaerales bacterium]|nr:epimerase [Phycisphaerales bacterium]
MSDGAVLVTGAAGFIASHACDAFLARGQRVVGVDNFDPFYDPALKRRNIEEVRSAAPRGAFSFIEGDVCDPRFLEAIFAQHRFEGVVHLAGRAGVRPSIDDPASYAIANDEGTARVFHAAARAKVG